MKKYLSILLSFIFVIGAAFGVCAESTTGFSSAYYNNQVLIQGTVQDLTNKDDITLLLVKKDADVSHLTKPDVGYIDSTKADENGNYSFYFTFNGDISLYSVKVNQGGTLINDTVKTSTAMSDLVRVQLSVDTVLSEMNLKADITNTFDISGINYKLILAFYNENNQLLGVKTSETYALADSDSSSSLVSKVIQGAVYFKAYAWTETMIPLCKNIQNTIEKSLKVLAIGNSFSEDATRWLYQIAENAGYKEIIIGNLYIGGCSLATHWAKASTNAAAYTYYKNTTGTWTSRASTTMLYGLTDESWDVISLQQVSGDSGIPSTYEPYLSNLVEYVKTNKTNPNAKLAWHMTWAYQANSTHADFPNYNSDQLTMYNAITDTVQSLIVPNSAFDIIIPSGTAIQNVRTSYVGDTLTRDGYHLSLNYGRYIVGLTWFHKLTGAPVDNITYVPSATDIPQDYLAIAKEAAMAAVKNPYQISNSSFIQ